MDNLFTVLATYLLSFFGILLLYFLSSTRLSKKIKECREDMND